MDDLNQRNHWFHIASDYAILMTQGYFSLSFENRRKLLITLAQVYDLNRAQVRDLIKQYLGLELPGGKLCVYIFHLL